MGKGKIRKSLLIGLISAFSLLALAASSLAWFFSTITINDINGTGTTEPAYFAYGTGTAEHPYGISDTRHLNNLAWLQYNGTFDDGNYHFELASDINAGGETFVIPPIGTEDHPFKGVFDGNGHTINNIKVTNDSSSFSNKPKNIAYSQPEAEIVGFFGVVGNLSGESYSSSVNNLTDFTLKNIEVESKTSQTLIGLAAGYVNAEMSGVKIDGTATINVNGQTSTAKTAYTDKLTDYGLVGYSTKTGSSGTYTQKLSEYYGTSAGGGGQGDSSGQGGSISIKDYNEWFFKGPRNDNEPLNSDSLVPTKSEVNHITKNGEFEAHYSASSLVSPSFNAIHMVGKTDNYFLYEDGTGTGKINGYPVDFTWVINNQGVVNPLGPNYKLTFTSPAVQYGNPKREYNPVYLNFYSNTSDYRAIYSAPGGSGTTNRLGTRNQTETYDDNVVYRLKEDFDKTIGEYHSTYLPLKFNYDNQGNRVSTNVDNSGYIVSDSVTSGTFSASGSPRTAAYRINHISNSLGSTEGYEMSDVKGGQGVSSYQDNSLEVLTYDQNNSNWAVIKDSHKSANSIANPKLRSRATGGLKTPYQLGLKKYETYAEDPTIVETVSRPLARNAIQNIFSGEKGVHGIHFDKETVGGYTYGVVSPSNVLVIDDAKINGSVKDNYPLLKGSIDFTFPEKGYINFFAGTYNSSNANCNFFSIYKISRNSSNAITKVSEILAVYDKAGTSNHIFKLHDLDSSGNKTGSAYYSDGSGSEAGMTKVFDVEAALHGTGVNNALYYFEVPVNAEEYALGMVNGSSNTLQGAYLIYLDLGINADPKDEVSAYSITTIRTGSSFPLGVDFIPVIVAGNGGESIGIYIASGSQGVITFSVTTANIAITDSSSISVYSFQGGKYSAASPPSGNFSVSGNSPGALVIPSAGGERVLSIELTKVNGDTRTIQVIDRLDGEGAIISSTYKMDSGSGLVDTTEALIEAESDELILSDLRALELAATLTRATGSGEFSTVYDTANCGSTTLDVDIETNGTTISIDVEDGYTFKVGGVTREDGSTYPAA